MCCLVIPAAARYALNVKDDVQLVLYLFYFIAMGTVVTVHGLRHIRIFLLM